MNFILLAIFCFLTQVAHGSHFRYGSLSWKRSNENPLMASITLTLGWRRSYFGSPNVGDSACDRSGSFFGMGDGTRIRNPCIEVTAISVENDWIIGGLTVDHVFEAEVDPTNGEPWVAYFEGEARLNTLQFWPGGPWLLESNIDLRGTNSPPQSQQLPIVTVQLSGLPVKWTIGAADSDAEDSLSFAMPSVESGEGPAGVTINQNTGEVTLDTTQTALGLWPHRVVIADSKGLFMTLDYLVHVEETARICTGCPLMTDQCSLCSSDTECPCSGTTGSCQVNEPPELVVEFPVTSEVGAHAACFPIGEQTQFTVYAVDPDDSGSAGGGAANCDGLIVQEGALPPGAVCTGTGTDERVFTWEPTAAMTGSHVVCFEAVDGTGTSSASACTTVFVPDEQTLAQPQLFGVGFATPDSQGGLVIPLYGSQFTSAQGAECLVGGQSVPAVVLGDSEAVCMVPSSMVPLADGIRVGFRKLPCLTEAAATFRIPDAVFDEVWGQAGPEGSLPCLSGSVYVRGEGECQSAVDWDQCGDIATTPKSLITENPVSLEPGPVARAGALSLQLFHRMTNLRQVTAIVLGSPYGRIVDTPNAAECNYPESPFWSKGVRNGGSDDDGICRDMYNATVPWAVATGADGQGGCGLVRSEDADYVSWDGAADVYFTEQLPDQRGLLVSRDVVQRFYFRLRFAKAVETSTTVVQFADTRLLSAVTGQRWNANDLAVELDLQLQLQAPFKVASWSLAGPVANGIDATLNAEPTQDCVDESGSSVCTQVFGAQLLPVGGTCRLDGQYPLQVVLACQDNVAPADCPIDPENNPPVAITATLASEDFCAIAETSIGATGQLSVHRTFDGLNFAFGEPQSAFFQDQAMQFRLRLQALDGFQLASSQIEEVRVENAAGNGTEVLVYAAALGGAQGAPWAFDTQFNEATAGKAAHEHHFSFIAHPAVYGQVAEDSSTQSTVTVISALQFADSVSGRKRSILAASTFGLGELKRQMGGDEPGQEYLSASAKFAMEPAAVDNGADNNDDKMGNGDDDDDDADLCFFCSSNMMPVIAASAGAGALACCLTLALFVLFVRRRRRRRRQRELLVEENSADDSV